MFIAKVKWFYYIADKVAEGFKVEMNYKIRRVARGDELLS